MTENHFTLPPAPGDLCFEADDFISPNFNVDSFLHEHRKTSSLETMRDDLGIYLKILRSAMIELINKDYADFVNLSKDLIDLDKEIDKLENPLGQLKEEVMQIFQTLDGATQEVSSSLDHHRRIREEKQSIHSLGRVYKSVSKLNQILKTQFIKLDILERAAVEFNQLKFHITRCKEFITEGLNNNCKKLEQDLMDCLANQLLTLIKQRESDNLIRCLRIYVTLDKIHDAEELIRKKIVSLLIENIIIEKYINNDTNGLRDLYNQLIQVLDVNLKQLLDVTIQPDKTFGRGFNFLVNSFWLEVEEKIELRLKVIFAPGNPELFHQRYKESLDFLHKLEDKCSSNNKLLIQFKNHPLYEQFLKKWNLPVYFQIRFQEIAGSVEEVLYSSISPSSIKNHLINIINNENDKNYSDLFFTLEASEIVWKNLLRTWSDEIFLSQLLHQFWKLNLQILSRYRTWCKDALKQTWILPSKTVVTSNISNVIEPETPSRVDFLVCLYFDLNKLTNRLDIIHKLALSKLENAKATILNILQESLDEEKRIMNDRLPDITDEIVQELLNKSSPNLKQVSDIPRLFRRTMREIPTQPCAYVKNSLNNLLEFNSTYQKVFPDVVNHWILLTLTSLTNQYFSSVKDVLESVQKTEESLRRLKQIRDKSSGTSQPENQGVTDDEKIRIQLEIDVLSFSDTLKTFKIDISKIENLDSLIKLVEANVKSKNEIK